MAVTSLFLGWRERVRIEHTKDGIAASRPDLKSGPATRPDPLPCDILKRSEFPVLEHCVPIFNRNWSRGRKRIKGSQIIQDREGQERMGP